MKLWAFPRWLPVATLLVAGCGKGLVTVEGTVTLDGKPVEGAVVSFVPANKLPGAASGMTDATGTFHLSTRHEDDGIRPGEFLVTVRKVSGGTPGSEDTGPPRHLLPLVYGEPTTTPLRCTVPPVGPVKLELTSTKQ